MVAVVAVAALPEQDAAVVAEAALPVMLIPHVPEALPPVLVGTFRDDRKPDALFLRI